MQQLQWGRVHLPRKRKPVPPSSSSFKHKRMAEMEALPHLTDREQRPGEIHHFLLLGAQGQPVADTMADPQSHLSPSHHDASQDPYSGLCQCNSKAQTVKEKQDFPVRGINVSCPLVFLPCCYQSEAAAAQEINDPQSPLR